MQNDFEKDVRQKMDELKLTPSATVWERVDVEIKAEKRKRRGLLWFLLAGLLFPGGWWFLHQSKEESNKKTIKTATVRWPAEPKQKSANVYPAGKVNAAVPNGEETVSLQPQQKRTSLATLRGRQKGSLVPFTDDKTTGSFTARQTDAAVNKPPADEPQQSSDTKLRQNKETTVQTDGRQAPVMTNAAGKQPLAKQPLPDKIDSAANKKETKESLFPKADSVLKKKVASAGGWQKQALFGAGISGYAEGPFFQAFNSSTRDAFSTVQNAIGSPPVVVAGQPSKITSGFHFSVGFAATKRLGKRWALSIGWQYAYASTHQKVGDKKMADTTVRFAADKATANGYYTNTGKNNYTNRFHFVEIPVSVSFKPSLRLPLYLSVGAAYGRLLATNALTYSSASNLYYQNKENYLRNAVSLSSAAQVEFFGKKKASLRTGPFVQYNLRKLRNENSGNTPHLLTAGLRTAIIF